MEHASVSYGKIKSALAASVILIFYENTKSNIADLLTKVLSVQSRVKLIKSVLNWGSVCSDFVGNLISHAIGESD